MIYWLPAAVSAVMLALSWRTGAAAFAIVAVVLQYAGTFGSPMWIAGLIGQVFVAIYLATRQRLHAAQR